MKQIKLLVTCKVFDYGKLPEKSVEHEIRHAVDQIKATIKSIECYSQGGANYEVLNVEEVKE